MRDRCLPFAVLLVLTGACADASAPSLQRPTDEVTEGDPDAGEPLAMDEEGRFVEAVEAAKEPPALPLPEADPPRAADQVDMEEVEDIPEGENIVPVVGPGVCRDHHGFLLGCTFGVWEKTSDTQPAGQFETRVTSRIAGDCETSYPFYVVVSGEGIEPFNLGLLAEDEVVVRGAGGAALTSLYVAHSKWASSAWFAGTCRVWLEVALNQRTR